MFGYVEGQFCAQDNKGVSFPLPAFQYGYGLFETIRICNGSPLWVDQHFMRLLQGLKVLDIRLKLTVNELNLILNKLIQINRIKQGSLKIVVIPAGDNPFTGYDQMDGTLIVTCRDGVNRSEESYRRGAFVKTMESIRRNENSPLSNIKCLNYCDNVIARRKALSAGAQEGLLLNNQGYVAEGAASNIFWYDGDNLKTPAVSSGILPGIARSKVLSLAQGLSLNSMEVLSTLHELYSAKEVFMTNSLIGVMPVTRIDNVTIGTGQPGTITKELVKRIYPS